MQRPIANNTVLGLGLVLALAASGGDRTSSAGQLAAQPASPAALVFEPLATYGGAYTGVVVTGTLAYATRGDQIEVVDVTDPAAPRVSAASSPLPVEAVVKAVGPKRLYLVHRSREGPDRSSWYDELYLVDLRDAASPFLAGSLRLPQEHLGDVVAWDELLLSAAGRAGIAVVDASEVTQPRLAGYADLGVTVTGIAAWQGRLLVAASDSDQVGWLIVLDMVDPLQPVTIGRVAIGRGSGRIVGSGDFAVVDSMQLRADGMLEGGARIVELAQASRPQTRGWLPTSNVVGFAATADRLYALERPWGPRGSYRLHSIDRRGLSEPQVVTTHYQWGAAIAAAGSHLLFAAGPVGLLTMTHQADGGSGSTVQEHVIPTLGSPQGVELAGGYAYLTDADSELWVLDVRDPSAPVVLGRAALSHRDPWTLVDARGGPVVVHDGLAYVARQPFHFQAGGLHIFDVAEPSLPRQIGLWDPYVQAEADPSYDRDGGMTGFRPPELLGDRIWLSGYPALTEIDVSDPANPRLVRHGDLPPDAGSYEGLDAGGIATDGSRLFVAAYHRGVYAARVSGGDGIALVGHADMRGDAADVALVGRHLLVAGYGGIGLRVLDADRLDAVRAVEGLEAGAIEVADQTAYVVATDGVHAFDVGDPTRPVRRGSFATPLDPDYTQIAVEGDLLALAAGARLVLVRCVEGAPLPAPTEGPTLTPWPTRTPGTVSPVTSLPTETSAVVHTVTPANLATSTERMTPGREPAPLYLPAVDRAQAPASGP